MKDWKRLLQQAAGWAVCIALAGGLSYAAYLAWSEDQPARWIVAGSLVALFALLGAAWRRLALASRAAVLAAFPVFLVGGLAAFYGPYAGESFRVGPAGLGDLASGLFLLALAGATAILWRSSLPLAARVAFSVVIALCAWPYLYGLLRTVALPDLLQGAAWPALPFAVPVFARPSVLAFVLLIPATLLALGVDWVRVRRAGRGSSLRRGLLWLAVAVPACLGALALVATGPQGLAARTFHGLSYQDLASEGVTATPGLASAPTPAGDPAWVESEGLLTVPKSGEHRFRLAGGGEGFLYLDGKLVIPRGQREGGLALDAGDHRIRVGALGAEPDFGVQWQGPEDAEPAAIPTSRFHHDPADLGWRRSPRQAAQVGVDWLQSAAVGWQREKNCFGCHVQAQALMGLAIAEGNQYTISRDYYAELADFTRGAQLEDGSFHSLRVTSAQYGAMALAYVDEHASIEDDAVLASAVDLLVSSQAEAGSLPADHHKPPIDQGEITTTSNALVGLRRMRDTVDEDAYGPAHAKALGWLAAAEPTTHQDVTLKILGLVRDGGPEHRTTIDALLARLRGEQQQDGGWKERAGMEGSNAYATGQALYAMKMAGVSVNDPDFKRGVLHLLETQNVHGSWPAAHTDGDRTEFAPTMWAVIGLAGSFGAILPELEIAEGCELVSGERELVAVVTNFTDSPIESVTFEIDGVALAAPEASGDGRFVARWHGDASPAGPHALRVVATNGLGETGTDHATLYTGPPFELSIASPGPRITLEEGEATCRAELSNPAGLPIESVEWFLDGAADAFASAEGDPFEVPCDLTGGGEGTRRLRAVASGCGYVAEDALEIAVGPEHGPGLLAVRMRQEEQVLYVPPTNIEFVLDMSGSMWGQKDGVAKYEVARDVLGETLEEISPESNLGLRVYGHRREGSCTDSELVIAPGPFEATQVMETVGRLRPKGKTPIGHSLRAVAEDLDHLAGSKAVILVSDGIETCGDSPAGAARALVDAGLDVRVHVVAFDVRDEPEAVEQLRRVAEEGGGRFFMADSAEELAASLREAVQVTYTLFDEAGEPVANHPLGEAPRQVMSGTYRVRVDLEPPVELGGVVVEKDRTTLLELVRDGEELRVERAPG